MAKYINADKFKCAIQTVHKDLASKVEHTLGIYAQSPLKYIGIAFCLISRMIDATPVADVVPVRHGHWVRRTGAFDKRDNFYYCSECHRTINIICGDKLSNYPYCHCGVKMDGGKESD